LADWTVIAGSATAVAALVTAWMAIETRKVAKATQTSAQASQASVEQDKQQLIKLTEQTEAIISQAQLARVALAQSSLPLLLPAGNDGKHFGRQLEPPRYLIYLYGLNRKSISVDPDDLRSMIIKDNANSSVWFIFEIRNIGTGLAIVSYPTLELGDGIPGGTFNTQILHEQLSTPISQRLLPQIPAIPPDEHTLFIARIDDPNGEVWQKLLNIDPRHDQGIETTFTCQDIKRQATYKMSVTWRLSGHLLRPGTPIYEGYDLDGIDNPASQP